MSALKLFLQILVAVAFCEALLILSALCLFSWAASRSERARVSRETSHSAGFSR